MFKFHVNVEGNIFFFIFPIDRCTVADATVIFVILRVSNVLNQGVSKELQAQIYIEMNDVRPSSKGTFKKSPHSQNKSPETKRSERNTKRKSE